MSEELTGELDTPSDLLEKSGVLILKVLEFSNENVHYPGQPSALAQIPEDGNCESNRYFRDIFPLTIFANGSSRKHRGFVSLRFQYHVPFRFTYYSYFEFCCVVSVIDASGNKRFLRSFNFPREDWTIDAEYTILSFDIGKYIKRQMLLEEPLDLLPGDALNLHIETSIQTVFAFTGNVRDVDNVVQRSFETEEESDGQTTYFLYLDSPVAERLRQESSYFRAISNTAMKEGNTRRMTIPSHEYPFFLNICNILMGAKSIDVESHGDICQIYILADKYNFPLMLGQCRRLVIAVLRARTDWEVEQHILDGVSEVEELAKTYSDGLLNEILDCIPKGMYDSSEEESLLDYLPLIDYLDSEWDLERVEREPSFSLVLSRSTESDFDFYR